MRVPVPPLTEERRRELADALARGALAHPDEHVALADRHHVAALELEFRRLIDAHHQNSLGGAEVVGEGAIPGPPAAQDHQEWGAGGS